MDFSFLCTDDLNHTLVAGCLGTPGISHTYLDTLLDGFKNTAILSIYSLVLAVFMGVIIGMIRTLPKTSIINNFLRAVGTFWVEIMRNIPLLVQVFLWYFVVPKIYPPAMNFPPILLIICALGFFTSARIAEQVRSGIESIPSGQHYAAMAMGFNTYQSYRYIILPRAIRTIMPPLTSEAMGIVKNSSIAFAVSINELMQFQYQTIEEVSHVYENYLLVTLLYIVISLFIFILMTIIERAIRIPCFQTEGR
ncbi:MULTISPECIES: amino acid ABC transporter permease [unclassified Bartonella]|uniref:amino acid ABC transporter permease n=1 Tax=unclassified Bartonella TaxID=2645622 RepID=UPI00099AB94F|nr:MULTISPECIES: amino acid ABC transporter permease [unclassified Bartonella]AQX18172.1 amino acid ABC transporter membrane protein 1, PAAT family [Bartonella sp. A1379B]AQX22687.1 glutamate/aspartate transport system permease protein [Bartonella sp. 11B]AQX24028.1 glutamate/aspartate transport system permease protein [Bartonella sp. 114]AQX25136.1 amino acid ABC transporter membrane protein 1, PAAT family [Bartonella sp. Coyote22sub2]